MRSSRSGRATILQTDRQTTQRWPIGRQYPPGHSAVHSKSVGSNERPCKAHPQVDVQSTHRFNFGLSQIERGAVQIG